MSLRVLHDTLKAENIGISQLIIPGAIEPGHPDNAPEVLAGTLWHLHTTHEQSRVYAGAGAE